MQTRFRIQLLSLAVLCSAAIAAANEKNSAAAQWAAQQAKGTYGGVVSARSKVARWSLGSTTPDRRKLSIERTGDDLTLTETRFDYLGVGRHYTALPLPGKILSSRVNRNGETVLRVRFADEPARAESERALVQLSEAKQQGSVQLPIVGASREATYTFKPNGHVAITDETNVVRGNIAVDGRQPSIVNGIVRRNLSEKATAELAPID